MMTIKFIFLVQVSQCYLNELSSQKSNYSSQLYNLFVLLDPYFQLIFVQLTFVIQNYNVHYLETFDASYHSICIFSVYWCGCDLSVMWELKSSLH